MLIQKELEAKIITTLEAALGSVACKVDGAWKTSNAGLVRWVEKDTSSAAFLNVAVGCPSWQTFTTPVVDFNVTLSLFVRPELDTQGTTLVAVAEAVEGVLAAWQESLGINFNGLDVTGLSVDAITLGGGASPTLTNGVANVNWTFTLSGSKRVVNETTNQ